MIEDVKEFYNNNSTMVIIAIVAILALIGMLLYRRMNTNSNTTATQFNNLSGMHCDLESGLCYNTKENMTQVPSEEELEQERQMMQQQQQMIQQHQMMQQQNQQPQQMSPEEEQHLMQQQQILQQIQQEKAEGGQ